jgi:hypothetical protein
MAQFVLKSGDTVEFLSRIDNDGDFTVSANGVDLFFVSKNSGELCRFYTGESTIGGISLDDDGRIVLDDD